MGILFVPVNNCGEVSNGLFVVLDHLVSFGSLMYESDVGGSPLDTSRIGPDRLLELLDAAVRQAYVVVNISFDALKWIILQGSFKCFNTFLVFLVGIES